MKTLLIATALLLAAHTASAQLSGTYPATISFETVTNVVVGDNSSGCQSCGPTGNGFYMTHAVIGLPPCKPYKAPTEKWAITNILQRAILTLRWVGTEWRHTNDVLLSGSTNRWVLTSKWEPAPSPEPLENVGWFQFRSGEMTNWITTTGTNLAMRLIRDDQTRRPYLYPDGTIRYRPSTNGLVVHPVVTEEMLYAVPQ